MLKRPNDLDDLGGTPMTKETSLRQRNVTTARPLFDPPEMLNAPLTKLYLQAQDPRGLQNPLEIRSFPKMAMGDPQNHGFQYSKWSDDLDDLGVPPF
jgi:hypothetical protein